MSQRKKKTIQRSERVELEFLEGVRRRVPGHEPLLQALGHLYTKVGRLQDGLEVDRELTQLAPQEASNWYNLACSHALLEDREAALAALARAVALGFNHVELMAKDDDLASLRGDAAFEAILRRATAAHKHAPRHK